MDRNVEFAAQLAQLVALYAHPPVPKTGEKAALRAARAAAKHGAVVVSMDDGRLMAGHKAAGTDGTEVAELERLFTALGITRLSAVHHAKQEEIRQLAGLLGDVARGHMTPAAFAAAVAEYPWAELGVTLAAAATPVPVEPAPVEPVPSEPAPADAASEVGSSAAEVPPEAPADGPAEVSAEGPEEVPAAPPLPEAPSAVLEAETPAAEPSGPLATELPALVAAVVEERHRGLFERLITSSEPGTLRRLLEPIQLSIEQTLREGLTAESVQLVRAMLACEECAVDTEMRRQFVIVLRRLTKPTLLRAYAMLHAGTAAHDTAVEEVLVRFGEDGVEAVIDQFTCAPTPEVRDAYVALLRRLPAVSDALVAMLDDERPAVVERGLGLLVTLDNPEAERLLGEQLGHASVRVRQAAARGLAIFTQSGFAADALLRALDDPAPEVRLTAAVAMQARREARLATAIVTRIDGEAELDVQLALVAALGRLAAPDGVHKLVALSAAPPRRKQGAVLRLAAIEAMGEARTPQAMVALQKLLEDREKEVREAAARLYTRARRQTAAAGVSAITDA